MRPIAPCDADRDRCKTSLDIRVESRSIPISFRCTATVGVHERERSTCLGGPPGSRSQRLRIKRNCQSVAVRRPGRACRLF
jgi:hypothetical protein